MSIKRGHGRKALAAENTRRILALIEQEPLATATVAERLGLNFATVAARMKAMKRFGQIHIAAWEPNSGGPRPMYKLGPGEDASKPSNNVDCRQLNCAADLDVYMFRMCRA